MMSGQNYGKGIRSGGYPSLLDAVRTELPCWHGGRYYGKQAAQGGGGGL